MKVLKNILLTLAIAAVAVIATPSPAAVVYDLDPATGVFDISATISNGITKTCTNAVQLNNSDQGIDILTVLSSPDTTTNNITVSVKFSADKVRFWTATNWVISYTGATAVTNRLNLQPTIYGNSRWCQVLIANGTASNLTARAQWSQLKAK